MPHSPQEIYAEQPVSTGSTWNQSDYRPLEGFVYAVSPFNFTAIGGNLAGAPAMMGNTVIWKPASTAVLSGWIVMQILEEAGLPPGVINFLPGDRGADLERAADTSRSGRRALHRQHRRLQRHVGDDRPEHGRLSQLSAHRRRDGRQGFHRGASVGRPAGAGRRDRARRLRVSGPEVLGCQPRVCAEVALADGPRSRRADGERDQGRRRARLLEFHGRRDRQEGLRQAHRVSRAGAQGMRSRSPAAPPNDEIGYFVQPTLVRTDDPSHRMLHEEIFGPIITAYVYDDDKWLDTLHLVDRTSPYALTGAVWAREKQAVLDAMSILRNAAGNFYINDKPTGAVVGQQPFGGARASGTNDKAGSKMNLMRWVSARSLKETFVPPTDWRYPFLAE